MEPNIYKLENFSVEFLSSLAKMIKAAIDTSQNNSFDYTNNQIQAAIASLGQDPAFLAKLEAVKAALDALDANQDGQIDAIASLTSLAEDANTKAEFALEKADAAKTLVASLNGIVTDLSRSLSTLHTLADQHGEQITNLQGLIQTINANISGLLTKSEIDSLISTAIREYNTELQNKFSGALQSVADILGVQLQ